MGTIAFVCCLLPSLLHFSIPGDGQCLPLVEAPTTFPSLQFTRPTDYLDCTTPIPVFQKRELDWLAHLKSDDSFWSNHTCPGSGLYGITMAARAYPWVGWCSQRRNVVVSWADNSKGIYPKVIISHSAFWIPYKLAWHFQLGAHRSGPQNLFFVDLCASVYGNKWNNWIIDNI